MIDWIFEPYIPLIKKFKCLQFDFLSEFYFFGIFWFKFDWEKKNFGSLFWWYVFSGTSHTIWTNGSQVKHHLITKHSKPIPKLMNDPPMIFLYVRNTPVADWLSSIFWLPNKKIISIQSKCNINNLQSANAWI